MNSSGIGAIIESIRARGYHNHRLEAHSDVLNDAILHTLAERCPQFGNDLESGAIKVWQNVATPAARGRKIDLLVGPERDDGEPDPDRVRLVVEHKSVITAHRNRDARYDDLNGIYRTIQAHNQSTIVVGTVLIGTAERVLNVPDGVKKRFKTELGRFEKTILPRLSVGDESLWDEFPEAVSNNRATDSARTAAKFRELPIRGPSETHKDGLDYLLLIPCQIDNVHPPMISPPGTLGIDAESEYEQMILTICRAYVVRWHADTISTG